MKAIELFEPDEHGRVVYPNDDSIALEGLSRHVLIGQLTYTTLLRRLQEALDVTTALAHVLTWRVLAR